MQSSNISGDIALGVGVFAVAGAAFYVAQSVFNMASTIRNRYLEVVPYTANSEDGQVIVQQNPIAYTDAKTITPSDNERTGIEFAYSFYLLINEGTFDNNGADTLKSVFYKGNDNKPWPLLSPGVFVRNTKNTLRVVMGSFSDAYKHIDIENIPVKKWFHVVLNYKNSALEVYVNGKLVNKLLFDDALPYNNYSNVILFSSAKMPISLPNNQNITFDGPIQGKVSNLTYTRYALSFTEIQQLYNKGVSNMTKAEINNEIPPYLADSWWINR
jgi:hypothetical protein